MSVIIGRALPDVRDGLKPVHRRVMFSMNEQGNHFNRPYRKSARIVGDVIGKYHPHGESAIYDALVRMAQDFSMRYPLVDGQGNFGSIDGDSPAAMRYTEARMTRIAHEMLSDLDKDTVNFQPNYDESLQEPVVLPARFPNLLVSGSTGIAVGMATNIPPHNLTETLNAFLHYIDHIDNCSVADLMEHLPGPDLPTAGFILGNKGIYDAYSTGRGVITMRARCEIETTKGDREVIVVHELPYMVNKARLLEKIADLVREKRIEGISELRDESDRTGMRMVIEVKRGTMADVLLNNLYKLTQLQTTFGIILLAVVDGQPRVLSLPQVLRYFLDHRIEVVERRTRFELAKAEARAHVLEGFRIALEHLDDVIEKIKAAAAPAEARATLMNDYQLSEIQAREILEMRLSRLTGLEQQKIQDEYKEVNAHIKRYRAILADRALVLDIIRDETKELLDKYGDVRRTEIVEAVDEIGVEDLIAVEDMVVTISHAGYVKRSAVSIYRTQRRGGKGKIGMTTKEEDFVEKMFVASTHDTLLIFTSSGKVYWKKVYEIPQAGRTGRGKAVVNLLPLEPGEQVLAYLNVADFTENRCVLLATSKGIIKKTELMAFSNPRASGVRAINIDAGDTLTAVALTNGDQEIFMATRRGLSLRFKEEELNPGDQMVGMEILEGAGSILTLTSNGYGKKTEIADYRVGSRGNKGVFTIKTTARSGEVVGIVQLTKEDEVMLITQHGKLIRLNLKKLRNLGRLTQGVRLIQLEENERVVSIAKTVENEDEDAKSGNGKVADEPPPDKLN